MPISKTFNATTYSIPTLRLESGWETTLSTFLQSVADNAATNTFRKQAIRKGTSSPITVSATTDHTIVCDLASPGAVTVNLPAAADKQIFIICDGKGDAATNAITIDGNGSETIEGATTKVINFNRGAIALQYSSVAGDWKVISSYNPSEVSGPGPSVTANAIARFSGTGGYTIKGSTPTIDDYGNISATSLIVSGGSAANNTLYVASNQLRLRGGTSGLAVYNTSGASILDVADTGAVTLGGSSATNRYHTINGNLALWRSNGDTGIGLNCYFDASRDFNRTGTSVSGGAITFNPNSAGGTAISFYANQAGDGTTTAADQVGVITEAGAWTLGNTAKIGSNDYAGQLLVGRTNGSAIAAGYVGQILESTYTSDTAFNATTVWGNNASVTLTPGVWLLFGAFTAKLSTGTGFTSYSVDVSATNGGTDSSPNNYAEALPPTSSTNTQTTIAGVYANVTTNTTYYLNYRGFYSGGSPKHTGRLRAVRIA